jgi:hypothetical protein
LLIFAFSLSWLSKWVNKKSPTMPKEARRIIDFHLPEEHRSNQGIKYYCFPAPSSPKNNDTCHQEREQALRSQSM